MKIRILRVHFLPTDSSNLASLIFSIFVNDIGNKIDSNIILFADNLKVVNYSLTDFLHLQEHIDKFSQWCRINKLSLNIQKYR